MKLEGIIVRQIIQAQKDKVHDLTHVESKKVNLIELDSTILVTRGWRVHQKSCRWRNVDQYILNYIKIIETSSSVLLYSMVTVTICTILYISKKVAECVKL
jgi:hypothetical protein